MKSRKKIFSTLMGIAITSQMLPNTYTIVANAQTPNNTNNTNILIENPVQGSQTEVINQGQTQVQDENQAQESQTEVTNQGQTQVQDENQAQESQTEVTNQEQTQVQNENQAQEVQNGIVNNSITLSGLGCQEGTHKFKISFNTQTGKLKVDNLVGVGYTGNHPFHPSFEGEYIRITLLDENGKIKKDLSLKGTDNVAKVEKLNEWNFAYGDRLRIKHQEADWRTQIEGNVTDEQGETITGLNERTSKEVLNKYDFQIKETGLHEVKASTNEHNKTRITLSGVGCQEGTHKFEVILDRESKTFSVDNLVGVGYTGTHPFHPYFEDEYIRITLLDKDGDIKEEFSLKGTDNVAKVKELNKWHFEYGDRLRIKHAEADWRTQINGSVTDEQGKAITGLNERTSKEDLNNYDFEITETGLHEVKAFTNEHNKTRITLSGVGCQEGTHKFEVILDHKSKTFSVDNLVGLGYTGTHPFNPSFEGEYIRITLLGNDGNIKHNFTMTGNENVGKVKKELSEWKFEYGDRLRIFHEQAGWRTKIDGNVTNEQGKAITGLKDRISKSDLNRYDFEITSSGLKEVEKKIVEVSDASSLIEQLKDEEAKTIRLTKNITLNEDDISGLDQGLNNVDGGKELIVKKGVSIEGDNHIIDFKGLGSLTLKGDNIRLSNVTIKTCANIGMQIYNSKQVYLKNVTVSDAKRYGLFVNGSKVKLENCTTRNNTEGGIFISRSMTLQNDNKYTDSEVKVIGRLNQEEKRPKVIIKNLEMLNKRMQENTFIPSSNQHYDKSTSNKTVTLSKFYCELLNVPEGKEIREITVEYN